MRNPTWPLIFLLFACSDIAPVDTVDLCKGDDPPSDSCGQCKTAPYAAECPRCKRSPIDPNCANAVDAGHGGNGGANGTGGAGDTGGVGPGGSGSGGTDAMVQDGGGTGGVGTAGSGGSGSGGSAPCGSCPKNKPQCLDTKCVECIDGADCAPSTPQCDPFSHTCVECLTDDQCKSQGKVCDENTNTCVACEIDKDCKDITAPQCKSHECKPCTDQTACEGRKNTEHCDTGTSSPTKGQCVQCLAHGDCKNPKPQCSTARKCVACTKDEACVDREDETVCDTDSWSDSQGECVECTGTKYGPCKDGNTEYVCDSQKRKCSSDEDHVKGGTGVCGGCISDAECNTGMVCVDLEYGNPTKDTGWFCQWKEDAPGTDAPHGSCANVRPFVNTAPFESDDPDVITVDRNNVTVCTLAASTCQAYQDFRSNGINCNVGTAQAPDLDDGLCGFDYSSNPANDQTNGNQDAYCDLFATDTYRCTMRCASDDDCPEFSCNTSTHHCNLQ
jgi:hypothetical protein